MPTLSQDSVKVLPMRSRSAMTLEEIRDEMFRRPPTLQGLQGGWASTNNCQSNLGLVGVAPPQSSPVIAAAAGALPKMLKARFYYWASPAAGMTFQPGFDADASRRLTAIDVMITQIDDENIGILFSTRTRLYLNKRAGVIASLNSILQTRDATIKIDRARSHLELLDADIFLWLTVQRRDKPQVHDDVHLDDVSGISGRDASSRTAELKAGVDFERPNFLTSVAEIDTLGPIDICFVHHVGDQNHSYEVRVHVDGGFEIRRNGVHLPAIVDSGDLMVEASLLLAYSLIPLLNAIYIADADNWSSRRIEVIQSAMQVLEERYSTLRMALLRQLAASAK